MGQTGIESRCFYYKLISPGPHRVPPPHPRTLVGEKFYLAPDPLERVPAGYPAPTGKLPSLASYSNVYLNQMNIIYLNK